MDHKRPIRHLPSNSPWRVNRMIAKAVNDQSAPSESREEKVPIRTSALPLGGEATPKNWDEQLDLMPQCNTCDE